MSDEEKSDDDKQELMFENTSQRKTMMFSAPTSNPHELKRNERAEKSHDGHTDNEDWWLPNPRTRFDAEDAWLTARPTWKRRLKQIIETQPKEPWHHARSTVSGMTRVKETGRSGLRFFILAGVVAIIALFLGASEFTDFMFTTGLIGLGLWLGTRF
jgi:hypothetical protein